jgi:hypothetical protein
MEEGGKEELEREEAEDGGNPVPWWRRNLGWYSPEGGIVTVFVGAAADYTKPNACRPAGKGKNKPQGHHRPTFSSSIAGFKEGRGDSFCVSFRFFLLPVG